MSFESISTFLYRRLPGFVYPVLRTETLSLKLNSKYAVASVSDVFCHPFYWQLYSEMKSRPVNVIDMGAHLGHFDLLVETCSKAKFGVDSGETRYFVFEQNPKLQRALRQNLNELDAMIFPHLLGTPSGTGVLYVNSRNFLTSSRLRSSGHPRGVEVSFANLAEVLPAGSLDIVKIDIEGGEYELIAEQPEFLERTNLLLIEAHQEKQSVRQSMMQAFHSAGLSQCGETVVANGQDLMMFRRTE